MERSDEKLVNQIRDLKADYQSLERQAREGEKAEKMKAKTAMEKGNMDGARIYLEHVIKRRSEEMNWMLWDSRLDAVAFIVDTQSKKKNICKSLKSVVKKMGAFLKPDDVQKMSETVYQFEDHYQNMQVRSQVVEDIMAGTTSLSVPEDQVNTFMQQVADEDGLEMSVGLPQPTGHAIPTKPENIEENDLSRRLA